MKMAPTYAQKIADALAAQNKLTAKEISTLQTEIMAVVSPLKTHTAELIKWQEEVSKEMTILEKQVPALKEYRQDVQFLASNPN